MKDRDGATLDEVALVLGVTRERVRQIEAKALERARKNAARMGLDFDALFPEVDRDERIEPPGPGR